MNRVCAPLVITPVYYGSIERCRRYIEAQSVPGGRHARFADVDLLGHRLDSYAADYHVDGTMMTYAEAIRACSQGIHPQMFWTEIQMSNQHFYDCIRRSITVSRSNVFRRAVSNYEFLQTRLTVDQVHAQAQRYFGYGCCFISGINDTVGGVWGHPPATPDPVQFELYSGQAVVIFAPSSSDEETDNLRTIADHELFRHVRLVISVNGRFDAIDMSVDLVQRCMTETELANV